MDCEKILYEELRPEEFLERVNARPIAYLPLGTLEWHGMHLPLGSDGIQSRGVFEALAKKIGGVVLPMLFLGPDPVSDGSGSEFYGMDAISFEAGRPQQLVGSAYHIDDDLFASLLDTICKNLSRAGFKVVVGHGHGPSTSAFAKNKEKLEGKYGLLLFNLWELGFAGDEGIQTDHAAANETSLVMALRPDLADISRIADDCPPVGVSGKDPRLHSSESDGRRIIQKNVDVVSKKLTHIMEKYPVGDKIIKYDGVKNLIRG